MVSYFDFSSSSLRRGKVQRDFIPKELYDKLPNLKWRVIILSNKDFFWENWERWKKRLCKNKDDILVYFDPLYFTNVNSKFPKRHFYLFYYGLLGYSSPKLVTSLIYLLLPMSSISMAVLDRLEFKEFEHLFDLGLLQDNVPLEKGLPVEVKEGAFSGFKGWVREIFSDGRALVNVELMGKEVLLECMETALKVIL